MGRIQSFERTTVVQAARDLFWDQGYEAASLAELERATGLNRSSLYHAFGSKRGLFDAAIDDYLDTVIRPRLRALTEAGTGRAGLIAYFSQLRTALASLPENSPRRGCLLVNCAAGLAGHDEPARRVVDGYRAELIGALRGALQSAAAEADADPAKLDERARTLASLSISAMLLARVNPGESVALLDAALEQIRSWFP
jgi:TetR/AcrR family transcriptional repressor of nem operon